jgi:hypothetical protein
VTTAINSDGSQKRDFRPADHAAWTKDAGSLTHILAGLANMRVWRHVQRELHEITPPRRLLLHDHSVSALGQCSTRHDAMSGAWSQHAWRIAGARTAGHRKDQRHALLA